MFTIAYEASPVAETAAAAAPYEPADYDPFAEEAAAAKPKVSGGKVAQKEVDVPNDSEWEEFRKMMTSNCECMNCRSDTPPPNAGCYKELSFEDKFNSAKFVIDESKHDAYRNYYWDEYIPKEATRFCKDRGGEYSEGSRECKVPITFSINYSGKSGSMLIKSKEKGDCHKTKTINKVLSGKSFLCDHAAFGLGECLKEDQTAATRDMQALQGMITTGMAVTGTLLSTFTAATEKPPCTQAQITANDTAKCKMPNNNQSPPPQQGATAGAYTDNNGTTYLPITDKNGTTSYQAIGKETTSSEKDTKFDSRGAAFGQAFSDNSTALATGGTALATSFALGSQTDRAYGSCEMEDGQMTQEGGTMYLGW